MASFLTPTHVQAYIAIITSPPWAQSYIGSSTWLTTSDRQGLREIHGETLSRNAVRNDHQGFYIINVMLVPMMTMISTILCRINIACIILLGLLAEPEFIERRSRGVPSAVVRPASRSFRHRFRCAGQAHNRMMRLKATKVVILSRSMSISSRRPVEQQLTSQNLR